MSDTSPPTRIAIGTAVQPPCANGASPSAVSCAQKIASSAAVQNAHPALRRGADPLESAAAVAPNALEAASTISAGSTTARYECSEPPAPCPNPAR